jgi:2'-5' RNA ligase
VVSAETIVPHTGAMHAERPPVTSLELILDPALEVRIRAEWQALAGAGLSSLAAHPSPSNRPHVTMMVRPSLPPLSRDALAAVVSLPLPLATGGLLLFGSGDRRVLARSVVPTAALLDLHRSLHALVGGPDSKGEEDSSFTRSGRWVPHITLARRLRLDALPQALRTLDDVGASFQPAETHAIALRRWDAATATLTDLLG